MVRGVIVGFVGILSFGSIMRATRLDKVGEAAILREISTVFAALIGWYLLEVYMGSHRSLIMLLIEIGAIVVEFGG